ncbi:hypothetical protein BDFB_009603, partial [Asbolus verrucosus]
MTGTTKTSIRNLLQVNLSNETCRTIVKKDLQMFSYQMTAVHELLPPDFWQRYGYNIATVLLDKTFFSEVWFHLSGYINSQNMRLWRRGNSPFCTSYLDPVFWATNSRNTPNALK